MKHSNRSITVYLISLLSLFGLVFGALNVERSIAQPVQTNDEKSEKPPAFIPAEQGLLNVMASSLDWGDFDNDGDMDLAVGGRINPDKKSLRVYRNDNGSFTSVTKSLPGISEGGVKWADFDGDGDLDLCAIGWTLDEQPSATLYENVNNSRFEPVEANLVGVNYGSIDWADYDSDGDPDLLITGTTENLEPRTILYENKGKGNFKPVEVGLLGVWKGSSEWGDYNNDGHPDLVITGRDKDDYAIAAIYKNNGDGSFEQIDANLMGVFGGSSSDWGDYDDDGDLDLLISGWNANIQPATVVYENKGNDTFESTDARLIGVNDGMAKWVDYDKNGRLDLMVTGSNADNEAVTYLYKNEPDTSFVITNINLDGTWRSAIGWADFNGDGYLDLAITGADYFNKRTTKIYRNNVKARK